MTRLLENAAVLAMGAVIVSFVAAWISAVA